MSINPDLRHGLHVAKMSQADLAEVIGMGRAYVNDIVQGRRLPPVETASKILNAINADAATRTFLVDRWCPSLSWWTSLKTEVPQ